MQTNFSGGCRTWKSSRIPSGSSTIKDIHSLSGDPELGPAYLKFVILVPHGSAFGDWVLSRDLFYRGINLQK